MDRKIDWLGRVTIPKEVRKQLHLNDNDMLTLEVQGDSIVLSKKAKTPLDMRRITKFVIDDNRKKKIAELKAKYQPGDRVRCLSMESELYPIPQDMEGEVIMVDDIGSVHVKWDNGFEAAILDIPGDALCKADE